MATDTTFKMDLETGNFIVTSFENIYDFNPLIPKILESHYFESEWDFDKNLIKFDMDGENAFYHLENEESAFHQITHTARNHHFSVMRYERI